MSGERIARTPHVAPRHGAWQKLGVEPRPKTVRSPGTSAGRAALGDCGKGRLIAGGAFEPFLSSQHLGRLLTPVIAAAGVAADDSVLESEQRERPLGD
jgi:hypothetical protein